jgi:hypothetical protein
MTNPADNPAAFGPQASVTETSTAARPEGWWVKVLPVVAVLVLSVVLRSGIVSIPLERDEGEYAYIADRWLAGDVPYRDAFNQKTPGVFLAYAALFAAGFRSVQAIHWLGHAALAGTIVVLYALGRRLFSHQVGWIAGLFTAVLVMDANVLGNAANTEVFAILPISAAIYFAVCAAESGSPWCSLLTGICGGLALSCKQVTLPIVVFAFAWVIYYQWNLRRSHGVGTLSAAASAPRSVGASPLVLTALLALGTSLVLAPICLYFAMNGAWSAFIDCVSGHNMDYAGRIPLRFYAGTFWMSSKFLYIIFAPLFAAAIGGVILARSGSVPAMRLCIGWLIMSFVAASVGGYYRKHYFILVMPPLALIAAYGIEGLAAILEPRRKASQPWIAAVLAIVAVAWPLYIHEGYYLARSPEIVCRLLYGSNPFPESAAVGKLLRENSDPEDRIFICGSEPQILFFAQRASASRYIFVYPLFAGAKSIARQKEVIEELSQGPPKFVVIVDPVVIPTSYSQSHDSPQYFFDALKELVEAKYDPFAASTLGADATTRIILPTYNNQTGEPEFKHATGEVITMRIVRRRDSPIQPGRSENGMKSMPNQLEENLKEVRERIDRAARAGGRTADSVRLVAVTKSVNAGVASSLVDLGVIDLAESRPQELWRKQQLLSGTVRWHLVGPLQKNKARRTLPIVQLIHSIDSVALITRLDELAIELDLRPNVLLEVNVSGESAKHGFRADDMAAVLAAASGLKCVRPCGLMTMAPYDADPENARGTFAALRELRDRLAQEPLQCRLTELSMGMSGDFEVAIMEGATIVRIGSALFRGIGEHA